MKNLLNSILWIAILTLSMGAFATENNDTNWFDKQLGKYYQDLNLTDQQKTQIRDIHEKHSIAKDTEVKEVLTPEQQTKWEELKNSRKEKYLKNTVDEVNKE